MSGVITYRVPIKEFPEIDFDIEDGIFSIENRERLHLDEFEIVLMHKGWLDEKGMLLKEFRSTYTFEENRQGKYIMWYATDNIH